MQDRHWSVWVLSEPTWRPHRIWAAIVIGLLLLTGTTFYVLQHTHDRERQVYLSVLDLARLQLDEAERRAWDLELRLTAAALAAQRQTPAGLALAARLVQLAPSPASRALLYQEALASPLALAPGFGRSPGVERDARHSQAARTAISHRLRPPAPLTPVPTAPTQDYPSLAPAVTELPRAYQLGPRVTSLADSNTRGWLLGLQDDGLQLLHLPLPSGAPDSQQAPVRLAPLRLPGLRAPRFSADGWLVLGTRLARAGPELVTYNGFAEPPLLAAWPAPFTGHLLPLPAPGRQLALLAGDGGSFALIDLQERAVLGAPRRWGTSPVRQVAGDPYLAMLVVLHADGSLAAGPLRQVAPLWIEAGLDAQALAVLDDGRWLAVADGQGQLWAAELGRAGAVVRPCAAGRPAEPGEERPASCLPRLDEPEVQALLPLGPGRVVLAGKRALLVVDLYAGVLLARIPTPPASASLVAPGSQRLVRVEGAGEQAARARTEDGPRLGVALWPLPAWIFEPPEHWAAQLEEALGLRVEAGAILPLQGR